MKASIDGILMTGTTLKDIQRDVWRVHARVMEEGLDEISQQSTMRNIWNVSIDVALLQETTWKCIGGGFRRLSEAIVPTSGTVWS